MVVYQNVQISGMQPPLQTLTSKTSVGTPHQGHNIFGSKEVSWDPHQGRYIFGSNGFSWGPALVT